MTLTKVQRTNMLEKEFVQNLVLGKLDFHMQMNETRHLFLTISQVSTYGRLKISVRLLEKKKNRRNVLRHWNGEMLFGEDPKNKETKQK
jgi:hypothetical protein